MQWSPHVTVAAVIRRDNRYLMVEESPHGHPVINQPAGHLEAGESLIEAVCREVLEETTRHFRPSGVVGIYQWTVPDTARSYLRFCFCGDADEPIAGQARDPDITANHWLTREDIMAGHLPPRSPLVIKCIDDALKRQPLGLEMLHALL